MHQLSSFYLNCGNNRPNLSWNIHYLKARKSDLESLAFLLPDKHLVNDEMTLDHGIIFFDDITLAMEAVQWFQNQLPQHLRRRIACYHAQRGEMSKEMVLDRFNNETISILFATKAAGMVGSMLTCCIHTT